MMKNLSINLALSQRIQSISTFLNEELPEEGTIQHLRLIDIEYERDHSFSSPLDCFTYEFTIRLQGEDRAQTVKVQTLHSHLVISDELEVYYPEDVKISCYHEDEIYIEGLYTQEDPIQCLLTFLQDIEFKEMIELDYADELKALLPENAVEPTDTE